MGNQPPKSLRRYPIPMFHVFEQRFARQLHCFVNGEQLPIHFSAVANEVNHDELFVVEDFI